MLHKAHQSGHPADSAAIASPLANRRLKRAFDVALQRASKSPCLISPSSILQDLSFPPGDFWNATELLYGRFPYFTLLLL